MIVRKYTNYLHQVYKKAHPETVSASDIIKANPLLKFSSVLSGRQLFARDMHDEMLAASKQHLDAALRTAVRFELDDLAPRQAIVLAQQETRRTEGNTPEERVVLFINMIRKTKCNAIDSMGKPCRGGPILKPKPQGPSRGHELFVGCSGWTPKFQQGHLTHTISDNVNENLLARGLAGLPLADDNSSIRQVLIILMISAIITPVPLSAKPTVFLGATVAKIDNAQSTKMLLAGKTPAATLRLCTTNVRSAVYFTLKASEVSNGLGVDAIYSIYRAELTKPLPERYVHSYIETPKGEKIIVTFVVYLLKLLDDPRVTSFDGDTTFKGSRAK
ncbi:hypothetical protein B0H10DRAFT_2243337 [Mycena sp. CBHHK59/15]|nr:hypothetical protein B0H10DRAFT_2243337 [Mycena sp. CBHHK59/15]